MIHYKDIFTKESECGKYGRLAHLTSTVDCFDCLELSRVEWERQVRKFKGQPLINAKNGLKRVQERMKELGFAKVNESEVRGKK